MDPRGRVVLITGASAGIGAAAARVFALAGARLALVARSGEPLAALVAGLPGGPHLALPCDVSVAEQVHQAVARAQAQLGPIDLVVNNAGVGLAAAVGELAIADLQACMAVNLEGPLHVIQAVLPGMRARGHGQVINVSSVVAARALPYLGGYAASKAALEALSEALRVELRGSGVHVTVVRPSTTRTSFSHRRLGAGRHQRRVPVRGVAPEAVARTLLRAARRAPRVAYVSPLDRLVVQVAHWFPGLADRVLAWLFRDPAGRTSGS